MPKSLTITSIAFSIGRRETSAEALTHASLSTLSSLNPTLNAFLDTFADSALEQARALDARLAAGQATGPLAGVPIALKDNICLAHGRTTCASRLLEDYRSPFTATAAQRLIDAGAVVIGKTNMDEFGMGSSTELSAFGPTLNPHDHTRVPGGSSGGSAAAVAAGIVPLGMGSDTGGSVRQPAAFCGCVGLKPTYGRVSRHGLVAYASSLDQIGPITRSVADAALAFQIIAGQDDHDSTTSARPVPDCLTHLNTPVPNLVIGVPAEARGPGIHPAIAAALDNAIRLYTSRGARVIDITLPHAPHAIAAYYLVACAEASSNLARFDGVRYGRRAARSAQDDLFDLYARSRSEGLGPEVQRRIMLGTYALSSGYYDAYYAAAMKARRLIKQDFDHAFAGTTPTGSTQPACHAILMPTTPSPAFKLGEKLADPLALYLEDIFTVSINLAGLPAISIPAGLTPPTPTAPSLPVGLQLIAAPFDEPTLLRAARTLEAAIKTLG